MTIKSYFDIIKLKFKLLSKKSIIKSYIEKIKNLLKQERTFEILSLIFLFLAFAYSLWRALTLSITHYEAITSIYHASLPLKDIIAYNGEILSNNHLLNTLLVKGSIYLFGLTEMAARLPALLGHIIYLTGLYKLLKLFFKKSILLAGVILLSFNPYLLDFFSLARGYALAMGFFVLGLYYFFAWAKNIETRDNAKNIWPIFLCFSLSALANISYVNIFLAGLAAFLSFRLYKHISEKKPAVNFLSAIKKTFNIYAAPFLSSVFLFLILYGPIKKMKRAGEFYFGGNNNFWSDTVSSLVGKIIYGHNYFFINLETVIKFLIILIIALFLVYIVKIIYKEKKISGPDRELTLAAALVFFAAASIILQHLLFNTLYVIERAAVYFIPLFSLFFLLLWRNLRDRGNAGSSIISRIFSAAVLLLILHFALSLNLHYALDWKYNADTKQVMEKIITASEDGAPNQKPLSIGVNWLLEPSVNFYILKANAGWLIPANRKGPAGNFDFYYLLDQDKQLVKTNKLNLVAYYNVSDAYLAAPPEYAARLAKAEDGRSAFSNSLLANKPELFYTINIITGIRLGQLTITETAGFFLIITALLAFLILKKRRKLGEKKFQIILFSLITIAWLPLYINFTYNNLYDLSENLDTLKYSNSSKRILRLCNMDNRQNLNGIFCRVSSFTTFIKNNLPAGKEVKLLTSPGLNGYFNYFLYPNYKTADQADYVLFYYAPNYVYKNEHLYKRENGQDLVIGRYDIIAAKSNAEFILKKQ